MSLDNAPHTGVRILQKRIVENGAGTYNADFVIPANAVILDVFVHAEALWTAATSAALTAGDYASAAGVIGSVIDADGFIVATNLKATDLLAGEAIDINGLSSQGGLGGAYVTVGTNTHVTKRASTSERQVRFQVVSVGAGTAGRTLVGVMIGMPKQGADVTQ